ncbi:50S ribosomal protein L30 [Candidatus Azoamicus ciliaticola]|uniref:Large ribosomal subunit protein uL30 n=1 Tax=Candidatus Azoamicus ciliaticola TaxID=2652803 RepID=A0A6J5JZB3_9GAMM|nr:50S ribosomal protein L30 [Candidatus Azoamicus ciliaticola]CAB3976347.1 50S ribosomal protein L30 [Candidatus Azoamicus ciliaticola]
MSKVFIKVILKKSIIGRLPRHRAIIFGLGLKKINSSVVLEENAAVLGMLKKVCYLVKVECIN